MKILVLGLGNELLADDGVGILAAREIRPRVGGRAEVVESSLHGMALLDLFLGYDRAILLDAVQTGKHPAGTIIELDPARLGRVMAPSPHYAGLPEMLSVAEQLRLDFPAEFAIFAVEVGEVSTLGLPLSEPVRAALPALVERAMARLALWGA